MQITKSKLRKIINEELETILGESMADVYRKLAFDYKLAKERKAKGRDVGTYQHKKAPAKKQSWADWIYDKTAAKESTVTGTGPSNIQPFSKTKASLTGGQTTGGYQMPEEYREETAEQLEAAKAATAIGSLATLGLGAGALGYAGSKAADVGQVAATGAEAGLTAAAEGAASSFLPTGASELYAAAMAARGDDKPYKP